MALLAAPMLLAIACAGRPEVEPTRPFRLSELVHEGDSQRRASLRLVLTGLEADAAGQSERARATYERAIQLDATNPYAYVAIARHWIEAGEPERGRLFVDQAEVLLGPDAQSANGSRDTLGARAHLVGLRGRAAALSGDADEAEGLLRYASQLAPDVWADGVLSADELR